MTPVALTEDIREKIERLKGRIGNTPLVRVDRDSEAGGGPIFAKLEWRQWGNSVKMRPAFQMMEDALAANRFSNGSRGLDSSSGNTGIALALIASELGLPLTLVIPGNISPRKRLVLEALDVELRFSPKEELSDGAIQLARTLEQENPGKYFYFNQYSSPSNPKAHARTALEIFEQTNGEVGCLVCGVGTGGTVIGNARELKRLKPGVKVIAVIPPDEFHGFEGLKSVFNVKHPPDIFLQGHKEGLIDDIVSIDTFEGYEALADLIKKDGVFGGLSSGAALAGARIAAKRYGLLTVTVFPDNLFNYVDSPLFLKNASDSLMERDILKIYEQALLGYRLPDGPQEVCGYIIGPEKDPRRNEVIPVENIQNRLYESGHSTRTAANGYAVHPKEHERVRNLAAGFGWKVKALYHTHVENPALKQKTAYFSDEDKAAACPFGLDMGPTDPGMDYIVVSVIDDRVHDTKVFRWTAESGDFKTVPLDEENTHFLVTRDA